MLIATLGAACISSSAILVTLAHVGADHDGFFRCALALPVLVPLAVLEQRRLGPRPLASRLSAVTAGLFLAVDLVLWNHAIADVGAGVATVLGNLQVLFVAVFAWLVLRERPSRRYLVMLPVVLVGVVLVAGMVGGHAAGLHPLAGIGFGVGTSAAYACFLLILRTTSGQAPHVAGQLADATVGATAGAIRARADLRRPSVRHRLAIARLAAAPGAAQSDCRLAAHYLVAADAAGGDLLASAAAAAGCGDGARGRHPGRAADCSCRMPALCWSAWAYSPPPGLRTPREEDVAVGKARRRRVAAEPVRSYLRRELDPQDRGQLCAGLRTGALT